MKYLLDTNTLLWILQGSKQLGRRTGELLDNTKTSDIYCSVVSLWEIRIKASIAKLTPPKNLEQRLANKGVIMLPILAEHTRPIESLPLLHRDPFDRMLIAQAITERLTLITSDSRILRYPEVAVIDASK